MGVWRGMSTSRLSVRRGWFVLLGWVVGSACVEEGASDVGEAYDPAAPMSAGAESVDADSADPDSADADGCAAEPWAYLPADSFRIRMEPPRSDVPWRSEVESFLSELGGGAVLDSSLRVVGNALQMDSLALRPGDEGFPGMVVAVARAPDTSDPGQPVEVHATGSYAGANLEPVCQRAPPEGFLVTSMPTAEDRSRNPRGPVVLSVSWRLYVEDGDLALHDRVAMQAGEQPLDVEQEHDQLSRQMLQWFDDVLPELAVSYEDSTLSMTLAADSEVEVEALLAFFRGMVPAVVVSAEP